jgi:hypothetical protein
VYRPRYVRGRAIAVCAPCWYRQPRASKRRNLAPVHLMPPGVEWTAISRTYCLGRLWRWSDSSTNAFSHLRIVTIDDASRRDVITALRICGCAVNCSTTSRQSSASSLPNKITTVKVFPCSHERPTLPVPVTKTLRQSVPHAPSIALRAPSLFVLNVRRCDRCSRTPCRLCTRNRSRPLRCVPPCAPRALLHLRREQTCVSLCLSHDCWFFRSRAPPTSPPPSSFHSRARFTAT